MAFKDGMKKANPVILEPIFKVEVVTPEDYMGDVMGDINSRRSRINGAYFGSIGSYASSSQRLLVIIKSAL